jgi:hypothetical protein
MAVEENKIDRINFDDKEYQLESLTPEIGAMFNMLLRLTREIEDAAYNLQKLQGAQVHYAGVVRSKIQEEGIEPIPTEEKKDEDK